MNIPLTIENLIKEADKFSQQVSEKFHNNLFGITDGKAVGTYLEQSFKDFLSNKYQLLTGNSASGLDLPDININTDIKVTSIKQPQSSCPYKSPEQKIFGLGYNLIVFVYEKIDNNINKTCQLKIVNCTFVESQRTSDYTTTKRLIEMLKDGATKEDFLGYLQDKCIPGDEITHNLIVDKILNNQVVQGYLTISNALQWRLQYNRVINLQNNIEGVKNIEF